MSINLWSKKWVLKKKENETLQKEKWKKCTNEWGCVDKVWNIKWCDTIVFIIIHAYCKK